MLEKLVRVSNPLPSDLPLKPHFQSTQIHNTRSPKKKTLRQTSQQLDGFVRVYLEHVIIKSAVCAPCVKRISGNIA